MTMRIASLFAVLLLVGGCYLPMNFQVDLNIDKSGKFAFRYRGDILAVTLMRKISFGKVEGAEIAEQAEVYERDLARDSGFKKIEHIGNALFRVEFDRQGNIQREKTFNFVRSNALFLAIKLREDGRVEVFGDRPPKRLIDALINLGVDARGTFRVWTNATVVSHNAPQAREGGPQPVYQWVIKSLRDPPPKLVLQLQ
jgi:hypothetical protein